MKTHRRSSAIRKRPHIDRSSESFRNHFQRIVSHVDLIYMPARDYVPWYVQPYWIDLGGGGGRTNEPPGPPGWGFGGWLTTTTVKPISY